MLNSQVLVFGALLSKHGIRVSGQNIGRGTFSQRHAMLVHQTECVVLLIYLFSFEDEKGSGKLELANSASLAVQLAGGKLNADTRA